MTVSIFSFLPDPAILFNDMLLKNHYVLAVLKNSIFSFFIHSPAISYNLEIERVSRKSQDLESLGSIRNGCERAPKRLPTIPSLLIGDVLRGISLFKFKPGILLQ